MKARLILLSVLMALCGEAFAQDIIHFYDDRPVEAKVIEINGDYILYKTYDNLGGPDYRMPVSRVARIVFENGTEKVFTSRNLFYPGPYSHNPFQSYGPLEYRWGHYYDRRGRLDEDQLRDYMGVSLYGSDYLKASRQYSWGVNLVICGGTLLLGSIVGASIHADFNARSGESSSDTLDAVCAVAGVACLGAGIPLWIKGNKKMNAFADDYNKKYGQGHSQNTSLSLGSTTSGVGLALRF